MTRALSSLLLILGLEACAQMAQEPLDAQDLPESSSRQVLVHAPADLWIAFRTDGADWTALDPAPDAVNERRFEVGATGRFGLAFERGWGPIGGRLSLLLATYGEIREIDLRGRAGHQPFPRAIEGLVVGLPDPRTVAIAHSEGLEPVGASGTFRRLSTNVTDFVGLRYEDLSHTNVIGMQIVRSVARSPATLDFADDAIGPVVRTVTAVGGEQSYAWLLTPNGRYILSDSRMNGATSTWHGLDSGLAVGDRYSFLGVGPGVSVERIIPATLQPDSQELTVRAVAPMTATQVMGEGTEPTLDLSYEPSPESPKLVAFTCAFRTAAAPAYEQNEVAVILSADWLAGSRSYTVELPDDVAGWNPNLAFPPGVLVSATVTAVMSDGSLPAVWGQSAEHVETHRAWQVLPVGP